MLIWLVTALAWGSALGRWFMRPPVQKEVALANLAFGCLGLLCARSSS